MSELALDFKLSRKSSLASFVNMQVQKRQGKEEQQTSTFFKLPAFLSNGADSLSSSTSANSLEQLSPCHVKEFSWEDDPALEALLISVH